MHEQEDRLSFLWLGNRVDIFVEVLKQVLEILQLNEILKAIKFASDLKFLIISVHSTYFELSVDEVSV